MQVLTTGFLKSKSGHSQRLRERAVKYKICYLTENDLPAVMDLQDVIIQNLGRPDLLQTFSEDFMRQHMGRQGIVLGVFVKDRLIAFRNIYFPDPWDRQWNLGIDIGLPKEELLKVANLQMVCVHPDFRGHSLALKMNNLSLKILKKRGEHHHICATVSPYNIWNIRILLDSGFRIVHLKDKYEGKLRYIVHQDIHACFRYSQQPTQTVSLEDLDTQKTLLNSGFLGVTLRPTKRLHGKQRDRISNYHLEFKLSAPIENSLLTVSAPGLWRETPEDGFSLMGRNMNSSWGL